MSSNSKKLALWQKHTAKAFGIAQRDDDSDSNNIVNDLDDNNMVNSTELDDSQGSLDGNIQLQSSSSDNGFEMLLIFTLRIFFIFFTLKENNW